MKSIILIPAYKPNEDMINFISRFRLLSREPILIVDDGSGDDFGHIFHSVVHEQENIKVINHVQNKGKGAALKTGFDFIIKNYTEIENIITADADGQHSEHDVKNIMEEMDTEQNALILGSRDFDKNVPFRSKVGNIITRKIFKLFYKIKISDTQSGLRGIKKEHAKDFINITFDRYEFETEMLLQCSRKKIKIREVPIQTIYKDNNSSSHFNPLFDSLKIYFVIFRYTLSSILSAIVDFLIFVSVYPFIQNILISTYAARCVSLFVNYNLVSKKVFIGNNRKGTFIKYISLVAISGTLSSGLIFILKNKIGIPINISKIIGETILYVVNFIIQKEVIFKSPKKM